MAEYISMKQVPGGTVTSVDDRILYDINLTNGKIYGCDVSYLGNNMIHINAGYGVIKGGLFEIEDHTEYVDFAESEPTPGQIYLHFDAAAQDKLTIVKETSANAHQLVQNEDANYESGVYEIQICTFTATTTALTDVTETWPTASGAMETLGTMEEVMANTEAGKVADALVTKQLNSNLTANSQSFKFGYQNGKYGFITREADTDVFNPFSSFEGNITICPISNGSYAADEEAVYVGINLTFDGSSPIQFIGNYTTIIPNRAPQGGRTYLSYMVASAKVGTTIKASYVFKIKDIRYSSMTYSVEAPSQSSVPPINNNLTEGLYIGMMVNCEFVTFETNGNKAISNTVRSNNPVCIGSIIKVEETTNIHTIGYVPGGITPFGALILKVN